MSQQAIDPHQIQGGCLAVLALPGLMRWAKPAPAMVARAEALQEAVAGHVPDAIERAEVTQRFAADHFRTRGVR